MERLAGARELLDGPLNDRAGLRANLRDMRRFNRLSGGLDLSVRAVDALAGGASQLSVLDVGTGGADIPLALLVDASRRDRRLHVTAIDSRSEILDAARDERSDLDAIEGLSVAMANGMSLPYADDAFDITHASLVLHHLEPPDAIGFLRELGRVARLGVVVNDVARSRLALVGAWAVTRLATRNRYSRHDGPLSIRRAYTRAEASRLLGEAGLAPLFAMESAFGHRWAIAAWEPSGEPARQEAP